MTDILARFFNENKNKKYSVRKNQLLKKLKNDYNLFNTIFPCEIPTSYTHCSTVPNGPLTQRSRNPLLEDREEITKDVNEIVSHLLDRKKGELEYATVKKNDVMKEQDIDPLFYIKSDLAREPDTQKNYKSINMQIKCLGNVKNRHNLIKGVNDYELNSVKYKSLNNYIGEYQMKDNNSNHSLKKQIDKMLINDERLPIIRASRNRQRRQYNMLDYKYLNTINYPKTIDEKIDINYKAAQNTLRHFKERRYETDKKKKELLAFFK